MRAPLLPAVSISQAVFSTSSRACSISIRDSAIQFADHALARKRLAERRALRARARTSGRRPARPCRSRACSGGCGPGRAAPARSRSPRPPRRACSRRARARRRRSTSQCPPWPCVVAEHRQRADDLDARRVERHEDHAVAAVRVGVGIGDAHEDRDLAAVAGRAARPPLAPVDDVLVAVALDRGSACSWRPSSRPPARSSRSRSGSRPRAAARASRSAARACRTRRGSPCCPCRAPRS